MFLNEIHVQAGGADISRYFKVNKGYIELADQEVLQKDILGIWMPLGDHYCVSGYWGMAPNVLKNYSEDSVDEEAVREAVHEPLTEKMHFDIAAAHCKEIAENNMSDDKWEQLLMNYPQIHPFGDERVFISIELKDFVVLRDGYQKLVNNSFLLHGFYNYRYLILGPDMELGEKEGDCFYIGVPGTYFEREKMVAVMFGFEGFECEGPVEIGKFGYYLRRVEL